LPDHEQKTEQPTQRKLDKARKEGQFPTSREFVSAAQFAAFTMMLLVWSMDWWMGTAEMMRHLMRESFRPEMNTDRMIALMMHVWRGIGLPMLACGGLLTVVMLASQAMVTRLGWAPLRLAHWDRLNPWERVRRMPEQNLPHLVQSLILLPVLAFVLWWTAGSQLTEFLRLAAMPLGSAVGEVARSVEDLLRASAVVLGVVGAVDLFRQRRRWMDRMKMSKQDIRDEMKEVEGNPVIKGRIRRLMRDLLRRRMMKDVETATAVIVNPTHYAVALRYVPPEMRAPKVVAKGKNYLALRIRDRAIRNQVPIVENPPLAHALYKSAQVGQEIPPQLYRLVAEVLAYIYRLMNGRLPGTPP